MFRIQKQDRTGLQSCCQITLSSLTHRSSPLPSLWHACQGHLEGWLLENSLFCPRYVCSRTRLCPKSLSLEIDRLIKCNISQLYTSTEKCCVSMVIHLMLGRLLKKLLWNSLWTKQICRSALRLWLRDRIPALKVIIGPKSHPEFFPQHHLHS